MRKHLDKILMFIASLITGILISVNLNKGQISTVFSMKSKEYKEAIEERNILYKEISDLKENNTEMRIKLRTYDQGEEKHTKIMEDMKSQLKDDSDITGTTEIQGSGIVIKISDGYYDTSENTQAEIDRRTLHAIDAALVLNELRWAGAEAIAINGYRILNDTGVQCDWAFIGFNDNEQTMEAQPFYFYALGDPDQLEAAIFTEGSHINKLIIRKLNVTVEKIENISFPATSRILDARWMERIDS